MTDSLRFCQHYSRIVRLENDRCVRCGSRPEGDNQDNQFMSELLLPVERTLVLPKGTILMERFKIEKHINNGRFGSIHLAEDLLSSMRVALKVTNVGPQCGEDTVSHLQREMAAYRKISNFEHVIKVYGLNFAPWEATRLLVLCMEYADGGTFRKWMVDHRKDLEARRTKGLDYFRQACLGVGAFHQRGLIHLDLKPENLLLFLDGVLKVSDFGTASYGQFLFNLDDYHCETFLSGVVGTPPYMSPEFIAGHPDDLDARADIYSLGIILYELVSLKGLPPFLGGIKLIEELHLKAPAPKMRDVGEKLAGVIARCLQKNPAHRYQSVEELLDDLEERPESVSLRASTEDPEREAEETWERASVYFSEGDFKEAARLTEEVLEAHPNHPGARKLKEELSARFLQAGQFYEEISRNLESGDLSDLTELTQEATRIYPDHPAGRLIQAKLSAKARQYRKAMEEGKKALREERWESALELLREAQKDLPKGCNVREWIEPLTRIKEMRKEIDQAVARGEFKMALRLARSLDLLIDQLKKRILALKEATR